MASLADVFVIFGQVTKTRAAPMATIMKRSNV